MGPIMGTFLLELGYETILLVVPELGYGRPLYRS